MSLELCFLCDEPTGNAGRYEDSIYDDECKGPYCEECYQKFLDNEEKHDE